MRRIHHLIWLILIAAAVPSMAADAPSTVRRRKPTPTSCSHTRSTKLKMNCRRRSWPRRRATARRRPRKYTDILKQYTQRMFDLSVAQKGKSDARNALIWVLGNNNDVGVIDSALKELLPYARDLTAAEPAWRKTHRPCRATAAGDRRAKSLADVSRAGAAESRHVPHRADQCRSANDAAGKERSSVPHWPAGPEQALQTTNATTAP